MTTYLTKIYALLKQIKAIVPLSRKSLGFTIQRQAMILNLAGLEVYQLNKVESSFFGHKPETDLKLF